MGPYNDHREIPDNVMEYLLTVADASNIEEILIDDINSFLHGLHESEKELVRDSNFTKHHRWVIDI
tara:strand:- start:2457 stop:2654 length:198 start_codon:yes stop_codon:yes gene_type:complete